jgi:hypothetical protein
MKKKSHLIVIMVLFCLNLILVYCTCGDEKKDTIIPEGEWVVLFEGSSIDHWRGIRSEGFPEDVWIINGNELIVLGRTEEGPGGRDIITKKMYSDFVLELEFKLTELSNSGIKYFVRDDLPGYEGRFLGPEYQLVDDEKYPDALIGKDRQTGALYELIPPPDSKKYYHPGQWNKAKIVVNGDMVEHWLNGEKIITYNIKSDALQALIAKSKFHDVEGYAVIDEGYILLQGHGEEVSFRDIRLKTW